MNAAVVRRYIRVGGAGLLDREAGGRGRRRRVARQHANVLAVGGGSRAGRTGCELPTGPVRHRPSARVLHGGSDGAGAARVRGATVALHVVADHAVGTTTRLITRGDKTAVGVEEVVL